MALAASDAACKCYQVKGGGRVLERLEYFACSVLHSGATMSSNHAERSSSTSCIEDSSLDRHKDAEDVQRS